MKTVAEQIAILDARAIRLRAANEIMREALKESVRTLKAAEKVVKQGKEN